MAELGFGILRTGSTEKWMQKNHFEEVINEYMLGNFCYFDLHPDYCNNKAQQIFYRYVSSVYDRERYLVANKMPYHGIYNYDDYDKIFTSELAECGVDYFDYYLLHCLNEGNYEYHEKYGGFKYLRQLKEKRKAKKIGFSFHGSPELLNKILDKYNYIDFVQLQINYIDWENPVVRSRECYEIARKHHKEIIVMEPIKGGSLSNSCTIGAKKYDVRYMADVALRFIVGLDGISIILSGMTELNHVSDNRKSLDKDSLPYGYYNKFIEYFRNENCVECTKCGYCMQACPNNIYVPKIMEMINDGARDNPEGVSRFGMSSVYYKSNIKKGHSIKDCIKCGACEKKCPQSINIRALFSITENALTGKFDDRNYQIVQTQVRLIRSSVKLKKEIKTFHQRIFLYGAGKNFYKIVKNIKVVADGVIDLDVNKQGKIIKGYKCFGLDNVPKNALILITVEKYSIVKEIMYNLYKLGYKYVDVYYNYITELYLNNNVGEFYD